MSIIDPIPTDAELTAPPVTYCPIGKRSKEIMERARGGTVPVTTATALAPKETRIIVHGQSHQRFDPSAKAAQTEIATLETAINQPHRRGADDPRDPRLAFPLYRFCLRAWPKRPTEAGDANASFRNIMYATGDSYAAEIRAVRVARGFYVDGFSAEERLGDAEPEEPTADELEMRRAAIIGLERTLERTKDVIRPLHFTRAPRVLESLCFDQNEPAMCDESLIKDCLSLLSYHFGHRERPRYSQYGA